MNNLNDFMMNDMPEVVVQEVKESPAAIEVEKAVLGTLLLEPKSYFESPGLDAGLFYLASHREIYTALHKLFETGKEPDTQILISALGTRVDHVGGIGYLYSLTEGLMRRQSLLPKIDILREKKQYRDLIDLSSDLTRRCYMQALSPEQIATDADKDILRAITGAKKEKSIEEQSVEEFDLLCRQMSGEEEVFIPTGIDPIDDYVGGYAVGELTVIGGRPQQGKSCALAQAVIANCPIGNPCHIFSIEMKSGQFLRRLWAARANVPFKHLRRPKKYLSEVEKRYVLQAMQEVSQWPLHIDDSTDISAGELVARARRHKRIRGTKFIGIDYLQKMSFGDKHDRFQAVTDASVSLAKLAKSENVAVALLSSVTEKNGSHRNEPPTLQNLRMSGDIQFEASTVLLIHREVDEATEQVKKTGQIIVAKGRSDQTGAKDIYFNESSLLFENPRSEQ